jgi:hypothetical protein
MAQKGAQKGDSLNCPLFFTPTAGKRGQFRLSPFLVEGMAIGTVSIDSGATRGKVAELAGLMAGK